MKEKKKKAENGKNGKNGKKEPDDGDLDESGAPLPHEKPKPAAKRKPKAQPKRETKKAKSKAKSKAKTHDDSEDIPLTQPDSDDDDDDEMVTPKKRLFNAVSEDDGDDFDGGPVKSSAKSSSSPPTFIDPKTGKSVTLAEVFENYMPDQWNKKNAKKSKLEKEATAGSSNSAPSRPKAKARSKNKTKAKAKAESIPESPKLTSPSIKKEQKRRKKKETQVIETTGDDMMDQAMQDKFKHTIDSVDGFESDDVKGYLKKTMTGGNKLCNLSSYWKKTSEGSVGLMTKKNETWVYFSFKYDVGWSVNMSLAYSCASLMVTCCNLWENHCI